MRYLKTDFQVMFEDHDRYSIRVRKPFLKFFKKWIPITYQEAENTEEKLLTFESFSEAVSFIDTVAK